LQLDEKRDLMNGFGDGLSRAFEMAITPGVFAFFGYLLDQRLGMVPVFTITLLMFALVGMFVRQWFDYDARMKAEEAKASWNRGRA
jgi:F0F1-type ATP synthase assembly protein I